MIAEEQKRRLISFKKVTVWFFLLYYIVMGLNLYIALLQLFNYHYFYFAYFVGLYTLEKMVLIVILRRLSFDQAEQLVMADALLMGWVYLRKRNEIQDICTFFIFKLYFSVLPTVYLQMWFYFGFELIEKDYIQFGWWRPFLMDFSIMGNLCVLAFCLCLYALTVENQKEELPKALHKLRLLSLIMNPFGYQLCLYTLFMIQIQADDKFGICVVFYGMAYQILIELAKKFFNFSLNINEFGLLNFIRRTGTLKAVQAEKQLSLPGYLKVALNFSGIIDLLVHVGISLQVAHVSFISNHQTEEYEQNFASKFLVFQNIATYCMVGLYILVKTFYAAYVSRSIWIDHRGELTTADIVSHVLSHPDIWFVIIFHVNQNNSADTELQDYRPSQDLLAYMDQDELSMEESKKLAQSQQQPLISQNSQQHSCLSTRMSVLLLARLIRLQHYKGFIDVYKTISVNANTFFLDIKRLRISQQFIIYFLGQVSLFPQGVKIDLTPTQKFQILADRFYRYGLLDESVLVSLDCSKQLQRQVRSLNSTLHQLIVFQSNYAQHLPKSLHQKILLDLQEEQDSTNITSSSVNKFH